MLEDRVSCLAGEVFAEADILYIVSFLLECGHVNQDRQASNDG